MRPDLNRVAPFPQRYINLVQDDDLAQMMHDRIEASLHFLQAIPESKWSFRYTEGKWSIYEVVQHLIDTERILCYRALCFARGETASLPGFDEATYAAYSAADDRLKEELLEEWKAVQTATMWLFKSFNNVQLERAGVANNNPIYVRALGFMIIGHVLHHVAILNERYLQ